MQSSNYVDFGVGNGVFHTFAHVGEGGLVHYRLRTFGCKKVGQTGLIANVQLIERYIGWEIGPFAGSQIVGGNDLVAGPTQPVHDVAADKACSPRNQYFHNALLCGQFRFGDFSIRSSCSLRKSGKPRGCARDRA